MKITHPTAAHTDERGEITDLVTGDTINHVAILTFTEGAVRGNHYHRTATAYVCVLAGRLRVRTRAGVEDEAVEVAVREGDLLTIAPMERHSLTALHGPAVILMMTTSAADGRPHFAGDTVRDVP